LEKIGDKTMELKSLGAVEVSEPHDTTVSSESKGNTSRDDQEMAYYGKRQQLKVVLPTKTQTRKSD
jgi:hypothetical protein